jgi:hypothetical protein
VPEARAAGRVRVVHHATRRSSAAAHSARKIDLP